MNLKPSLILLFVILTTLVSAQGISFFEGNFDEAKKAAKAEGKYIFMDAYAVWCGPCKMMTKNVFPQAEVGDFFNENFINLKVDMEKGEGLTLRNIYQVSAYPTLFVLDADGKIVAEIKGARNADALIDWAKKSILPSQATFDKLRAQYSNGDRTPALLKSLIKINDAYKNDYSDLMTEFLGSITEAEKIDDANADFIFNYAKTIFSPSLAVLKTYESYFRDIKGTKSYEQKLREIATETVIQAAEMSDEDKKNEALSFLKENKVSDFKKQQDMLNVKYYFETKEWNNYHAAASKVIKKYAASEPSMYQETAWNYYQNIEDEQQLADAEKWMQKARETKDDYSNNYTQACLLYKLKSYTAAKEALTYAKTLTTSNKEIQQVEKLINTIDLAQKK